MENSTNEMIEMTVKVVLCDIEGTTTSISFVKVGPVPAVFQCHKVEKKKNMKQINFIETKPVLAMMMLSAPHCEIFPVFLLFM